jgi:hypothetical protein
MAKEKSQIEKSREAAREAEAEESEERFHATLKNWPNPLVGTATKGCRHQRMKGRPVPPPSKTEVQLIRMRSVVRTDVFPLPEAPTIVRVYKD